MVRFPLIQHIQNDLAQAIEGDHLHQSHASETKLFYYTSSNVISVNHYSTKTCFAVSISAYKSGLLTGVAFLYGAKTKALACSNDHVWKAQTR